MPLFSGKSKEELSHYSYHWFWGLRYNKSVRLDNIAEGLCDSNVLYNCLSQEKRLSQRNVIIRLFYRLFNINNYALNRYRLAAFKAIKKYNASIQGRNIMESDTLERPRAGNVLSRLVQGVSGLWRRPSKTSVVIRTVDGATSEAAGPTEDALGEQTITVTESMQPHLQTLGIYQTTDSGLTWADVKKAYYKMARIIRTDKGGDNGCGLITLSFPADSRDKKRLSDLTENKPCYLLSDAKIYFVNEHVIPMELPLKGVYSNGSIFPMEMDKKEPASKAQLNAINLLTSHVALVANALASLKTLVSSNKEIPSEGSSEWDVYFHEEMVQLRRGVDELARGVDEFGRGVDEFGRGVDELRLGVDEVRETLKQADKIWTNVEETYAQIEKTITRVTENCANTDRVFSEISQMRAYLEQRLAEAEQSDSDEMDDNSIDAIDAGTTVATSQPSNDASKSKSNFWKRGGKVPLDSDTGDKPPRP